MRGMGEALDKDEADYQAKKDAYEKMEKEYLMNALDGFSVACQNEGFPMCGMDEITVDYLMGVLAMECGKYDFSAKMLSNVIVSKSSNPRVKERARDAKEMLKERIKNLNK